MTMHKCCNNCLKSDRCKVELVPDLNNDFYKTEEENPHELIWCEHYV